MAAQEEQQSPGIAPDHQDRSLHVVRRLRRAFLSICRCGDVVFSPYRLTTEQYALMRSVQRQPGIRQADITDRIFAEPNTVTAMVSLLERRNIIRRKPSPTDKRVRQLYLTAHGNAVMQRLAEEWKPMREILRRYFSSEEGMRALDVLDEVATHMSLEREKLLSKLLAEGMEPEESDLEPAVAHGGSSLTRGSRTRRQ